MANPAKVSLKHAGAWKEPDKIWLKDGGVWKEPIGGWVKTGGVWEKFWPKDVTLNCDTYFNSVVYLSGFNGADGSTAVVEETGKAVLSAVNGNAQIDTAQFKFGSSSLLLDGAGDYVSYADSDNYAFDAGQFTIETFVRFNAVTPGQTFVAKWNGGTTVAEWAFWFDNTSKLGFLFYDSGGVLRTCQLAWAPVVNTWYHVAVDRDATGVVRLYVNGAMLTKATLAQTMRNSNNPLQVGTILPHSSAWYLNGWLDELRITKGVARYASDSGYTVPTAAFPRVSC